MRLERTKMAMTTVMVVAVAVAGLASAALHPGDLLERCESKGRKYIEQGTALIVTTSHSKLGPQNCSTCQATGVFSSEMTVPYYIFKDAGLNVSIATIAGGDVPVDPTEKLYTSWDVRFFNDAAAVAQTKNTAAVHTLNLDVYDIVWLAGGWGAAWDLAGDATLIAGVSQRFQNKQLLGSVCHGALGLVNASKADGSPLVRGLNVTAVTNRQLEELKIGSITPMHPESELRLRGANFECEHGVVSDLTASLTVVDGRLVTGQNQNSGCETAQRLLDLLASRHSTTKKVF